MSKKREIEFVIRPDGTVEEKVTGFSGSDCEKVTEAIEQALGEVAKREHTSDFYDQPHSTDGAVTARI